MTDMDDMMSDTSSMAERRAADERREFTWRTVFFGFTRSRRHSPRRGKDSGVIFLDWHHPWLFFLAVGTMLLSCVDAFMTLWLLENGMVEANPIMAAVMGRSTATFAATKMLMTGIGILAIVYLAKARFLNRVRCGLILTAAFTGYACLVCFEIVQYFKLV